MCMMPHTAPCECVCAHCAHRWAACVSPSSKRTTVESNMKVSIIYTWLVKTLHNVLFSFALSLVLFLPTCWSWLVLYIDFVAFSFSVSPTVGYVQHSTLQNMCTLRRISRAVLHVLHCHEVSSLPRPSTSIVSACDA